jgi:hypothetical protein
VEGSGGPCGLDVDWDWATMQCVGELHCRSRLWAAGRTKTQPSLGTLTMQNVHWSTLRFFFLSFSLWDWGAVGLLPRLPPVLSHLGPQQARDGPSSNHRSNSGRRPPSPSPRTSPSPPPRVALSHLPLPGLHAMFTAGSGLMHQGKKRRAPKKCMVRN